MDRGKGLHGRKRTPRSRRDVRQKPPRSEYSDGRNCLGRAGSAKLGNGVGRVALDSVRAGVFRRKRRSLHGRRREGRKAAVAISNQPRMEIVTDDIHVRQQTVRCRGRGAKHRGIRAARVNYVGQAIGFCGLSLLPYKTKTVVRKTEVSRTTVAFLTTETSWPEDSGASGTSPACPWFPCHPRCATRSACRNSSTAHGPSIRHSHRRCAHPSREHRSRADRECGNRSTSWSPDSTRLTSRSSNRLEMECLGPSA